MSTLPMRGTFGSRAKQIANQRRTADALRAVGLRNDVQGQWTQGSGGTALFGQQPEIYTMPDWSEQLLPQAQQFNARMEDDRANKAETDYETQAREQAVAAYKNFPSLNATRQTPAITLPAGQAGPVMPAREEQYTRSPEEYQTALTDFATGLDPSNPYLDGMQGKVLEKSMGLASENFKQNAALEIKRIAANKAQQDPNSLKEYLAGHPGVNMSDPEVAADYMSFVRNTYRGTSAQKNAGATGMSVAKILEFAQNPAKATRLTAEIKRLEDSVPGMYQQADGQGLTGQAREDYVANLKEQLTNQMINGIEQEFSLGAPVQQASPQSPVGTNPMEVQNMTPDFAEPSPAPAGPERKVALRSPEDMQLSPLERAEIQSQANQGNLEAIEAAKQFGIPVGGKVLKQSVAATNSILPSNNVRPAPASSRAVVPSVDPIRLETDKTTAKKIAENKVDNAESAKGVLPQLDNIETSLNKLIDEKGNLTPALTKYIGPRNAYLPRALLKDKTVIAGDALEGLRSQITMLNLAEAKKSVGQSFGSMQVQEWDRFTDLLGKLNRDMSDTTAKATLKQIRDFVTNKRPILEAAIRGGTGAPQQYAPQAQQSPAGIDAAVWQHMTPEERKLFQ